MAQSLGISTVFSSGFPSISLATCIYTAPKPANLKFNTMGVSPKLGLSFSAFSIISTIALGFLSDSIVVQTNSALDNGLSLWKAPSSLPRPTAARMPSSTPTLVSPPCHGVQIKQTLAAVATICAFLVGSAYVMYLASQNPFSPSSEPARDYQRFAQRDRRPDPPPWPLPPLSRRSSRSQPPNRRSGSSSIGGGPRKAHTHHNRSLRRPFREDPPPPPPPSFAGFIEDFPKPRSFDELIIMNTMLGALFGWILKKLIGYFLGHRASQKTKNVSSSLPKGAASSIPRKTGDRSRPTPSRSRLPEQRQTPLPPLRPSPLLFINLIFTLAGSVLFGLKARRRAINVRYTHARPTVPLAVVRPRDSSCAYPVPHELVDTPCIDRLPSSKTTPTLYLRQPAITRRSPSAVRLSKIQQVKYFHQDEIIGFEHGPKPRGRSSSIS